MPGVRIYWYRQGAQVPMRTWLDSLTSRSQIRCVASMTLLSIHGHAMRRPAVAHLREGLYELRIRDGRLHMRVLFFFDGVGVVVMTHGFIKKTATVPERELALARRRREAYLGQPAAHRFRPED